MHARYRYGGKSRRAATVQRVIATKNLVDSEIDGVTNYREKSAEVLWESDNAELWQQWCQHMVMKHHKEVVDTRFTK